MSNAINKLAAQLADLTKRVNDSTPQLSHSSIEDGGAIEVNDAEGNLVASVGGQFDGSFMAAPLSGPTPPTPTPALLEPVNGGLKVKWDGFFTDADMPPMDFARVEIHAADYEDADWDSADNLRATFETPRGAEVTLLLEPVQHWVVLRARSMAGKIGPVSEVATDTALAVVTPEQLAAVDASVQVAQQAASDAAAAGAAAQAAADSVAAEVDGIPAQIATAKGEAISSSAATAQQKADAAQAAAISAAAATAQAKADQAKADALTAAAVTAQEKADAAKAQAIADATAAAATTAQTKADLAQAAAINAAQGYVQSRATDLVTNGTAITKTNSNFSAFDYSNDAPAGASGSFVTKTNALGSYAADETIPYDPSKKYRLSFQIRQTVAGAGATNNAYGYVMPCDVDGNPIDPTTYMYITGTTTTLAQALNPGDTTVKLTSAANWYGTAAKPAGANYYFRKVMFWDYVDSTGKAWPVGSYTRNMLTAPVGYAFSDGAVDAATGIITLNQPYSGPAKPAGTPVSQPSAGGSYLYMPTLTNKPIDTAWTSYSDTLVGGFFPSASQAVPATGGATWTSGLPPATAKLRVGWLLNYAGSGAGGAGKMAVASVSLSDAAAASYDANNITTVQIKDDAITAPKILAGAIVAGKLAADAVAANNIQADAILARNIKAGEITASKIAAGTITANEIKGATITADKLVAGTITAASGVIGSLDASKITTGTLDASLVNVTKINAANITVGTIAGSQLAATAIDGKTITGATVRTAASGARVVLDSTGFKSYDGSGVNTAAILASDGSVSIAGKLRTALTGRRIEMGTVAGEGISSAGSLTFFNGHAAETAGWATPPSMFADIWTDVDGNRPVLSLRSGFYGKPDGTPNVPPNGAQFHSSYIMLHGSADGESLSNPPEVGTSSGPHVYLGPYLKVYGAAEMNGLTVDGDIKSKHTTGSYNRDRSPGVAVRRTVAVSSNNAQYLLLTWEGHFQSANADATVWTAAQPSRFYAPVTGRYAFSGNIVWAANATGYRIATLRVNSAGSNTGGGAITYWTCQAVPGTGTSLPISFSEFYMDAGDYVECFASQNSGGALGVGAGNGISSTLCMSYVGPA